MPITARLTVSDGAAARPGRDWLIVATPAAKAAPPDVTCCTNYRRSMDGMTFILSVNRSASGARRMNGGRRGRTSMARSCPADIRVWGHELTCNLRLLSYVAWLANFASTYRMDSIT